jgi:hypothetical protein
MKHIILFRYHNQFELCKERIELFRRLNPNTEIHGIYGGDKAGLKSTDALPLDSNFRLREKLSIWKWQFGDTQIYRWYKKFRKKVSFDYLHLLEWDLVMTRSLNEIHDSFSADVGLVNVKPVKQLRDEGWPWLVEEFHKEQSEAFIEHVSREIGPVDSAKVGWFPGAIFSHRFLEAAYNFKLPIGGNDELRVGILAAALNMDVAESGITFGHHFNCDRIDVPWETINNLHRQGVSVFHPVYTKGTLEVEH